MGIEAVVANDGVDAGANERLRKATELYRLSLQLQTVGLSTQIGELLFLSCLNNLGNACGLLGDDKAEDRAHEQLLSALMYLTQTCSNNDDPQRQQQRQRQRRQQKRARRDRVHRYESFFRNIFKKESSNKAP